MESFTKPIPSDYELAEVLAIYPSATELPGNILKFHIKFSKPMNSLSYQYLSLMDARGKEIDRGLLTQIPELWNEDFTELTVWIEPGRIKRGLGPNEKLGPVLNVHESYSLFISPEIRDGNGVIAKKTLTKKFISTEADRVSPDIKHWMVEQIDLDGKTCFKISFDEILDFGSGSQAFHMQEIAGRWSMLPGEKSILFIPNDKMKVGEYDVLIDPRVEDLAGNNLLRLFDSEESIDLEKKEDDYVIKVNIKEVKK